MLRFNTISARSASAMGQQGMDAQTVDVKFVTAEIHRWRTSKRYKEMLAGCHYYEGKHDILQKVRTAIGDGGKLITVDNLPNNRIVDNQYSKMVDQKSNYLVGQPFVIQCENQQFVEALRPYLLTKKFFRLMKAIAKDSLNCGIGWLYPHYDERGDFVLTRIKPYELIPEWADAEHTRLDAAIRVYDVTSYEGDKEVVVSKVEVYNPDGIYYFELKDDNLIPEDPWYQSYFTVTDDEGNAEAYNWDDIPLVPFRYNAEETPLIRRCKSMQDGLNRIESNWQDQMEEDPRNTIMVLVNYDGENLGEFRRNLATYGAVKVRSADGSNGDVRTLQIEVNAENYKAIIHQFKKAIIENCMGYDAKDDRLGGNPNEMNLKSMYSDIDLDANGMETEYQAAFEELVWFLACHLSNIHAGDYDADGLDVVFNRDMLMNEADAINNCKNSVGLVSDETILANHPWVDDPLAELEKVKAQKEAEIDLYGGFGRKPDEDEDPHEEDE